jgi:hypothetical protein
MTAKPKRSEADVKRSVMELLRMRHIMFFRMNAGSTILANRGGGFRKIEGHPAGTADILAFIALHPGGPFQCSDDPVWIELKSSTGKQSPEQKEFQKMVESEGHVYLLARSAAEVEEWLEANT